MFEDEILSLVSIWSSRSSQSSQIMFGLSKRSHGNATRTIVDDVDNWDDLDRLDRVEFYPDDRDDRANFKTIIWRRSQTTGTIGTIEGYPRNHHFYTSNREYIRPGWRWSQQSTTKCSHRVWALSIFEIRESPWRQVLDVIVCFRRTLLASRLRIIKRKSRLKGTRLFLRIKIIII